MASKFDKQTILLFANDINLLYQAIQCLQNDFEAAKDEFSVDDELDPLEQTRIKEDAICELVHSICEKYVMCDALYDWFSALYFKGVFNGESYDNKQVQDVPEEAS